MDKKWVVKYGLKIVFLFIVGTTFAQNDANIAQKYFQATEYDKALIIYEKLYKQHRGNAYYQQLFNCYYALKDWQKAEKINKKRLKKYRKDLYAHLDKFLLAKAQKKSDAESVFDSFSKSGMVNFRNIQGISLKLERNNLVEYAVKLYEDELTRQYNFRTAYYLLRLYNYTEEKEKLVSNYFLLIKNSPGSYNSILGNMQKSVADYPEILPIIKKQALISLKEEENQKMQELLIWVFTHQKEFDRAFRQEKSLERKHKLRGDRILNFAILCASNEAWNSAISALDFLMDGTHQQDITKAAHEAKLRVLFRSLESQKNVTEEEQNLLFEEFDAYFLKYPRGSSNLASQQLEAKSYLNFKNDPNKASNILIQCLEYPLNKNKELANSKLLLADILVEKNQMWDALLYYNQVEKDFEFDKLGHLARFKKAKVSFYQADFQWAFDQLKVLRSATSKVVANNAMELSLLIQESLNLDSNIFSLQMYARADLYFHQKRFTEAQKKLSKLLELSDSDYLIDDAYYLLFKIAQAQNNFEREEKYLNAILGLPESILKDNALFEKAKLFQFSLNKEDKAKELYEKLLIDYPSSYWASQTRINLKKLKKTHENNL
ncbi:MAG: hypothetical protein N4A45_08210 [Flavobacteriales bacterium]|nr:hypothetical protein [Flavobacteriales bacterium]